MKNLALQDFKWVSVTAGLVPGPGRGSRFRASRSDPSGPCVAEAFRYSFARGCAQPRCLSQFRLSIQATPRWGPRSCGEVSAHPFPKPGMSQPTPQESWDSSTSKARPYKPEPKAPVPGGVTDHCEPSGRGDRDLGRRARLLFEAAGRARPDHPRPWAQTGLDRKPPHSDARDGGSRSRAAARYSSVASLHGAEALALTESKRPIQFPEEPKYLYICSLIDLFTCLRRKPRVPLRVLGYFARF